MEHFPAIIPAINQQAASIDYDPHRGITMAELTQWFTDLSNIKPPKPEYILSLYEAQTLPLPFLHWLGNNYTVLTSIETANAIKERESNEPTPTNPAT